MKIILNNIQEQLLKSSTNFNILCIVENSLHNNILTLSNNHIESLYDYCCDQYHEELNNLAINILKNDRNVIKPIDLNFI